MSANAGGRPCSICSRPDRLAVECEVIEVGLNATATKYGIQKSSLSRHMSAHAKIDRGESIAIKEPPPEPPQPAMLPDAPITLPTPETLPAPRQHRHQARSGSRPQPGAMCQQCGGSEWWADAHGAAEWACSTCIPRHHFPENRRTRIET